MALSITKCSSFSEMPPMAPLGCVVSMPSSVLNEASMFDLVNSTTVKQCLDDLARASMRHREACFSVTGYKPKPEANDDGNSYIQFSPVFGGDVFQVYYFEDQHAEELIDMIKFNIMMVHSHPYSGKPYSPFSPSDLECFMAPEQGSVRSAFNNAYFDRSNHAALLPQFMTAGLLEMGRGSMKEGQTGLLTLVQGTDDLRIDELREKYKPRWTMDREIPHLRALGFKVAQSSVLAHKGKSVTDVIISSNQKHNMISMPVWPSAAQQQFISRGPENPLTATESFWRLKRDIHFNEALMQCFMLFQEESGQPLKSGVTIDPTGATADQIEDLHKRMEMLGDFGLLSSKEQIDNDELYAGMHQPICCMLTHFGASALFVKDFTEAVNKALKDGRIKADFEYFIDTSKLDPGVAAKLRDQIPDKIHATFWHKDNSLFDPFQGNDLHSLVYSGDVAKEYSLSDMKAVGIEPDVVITGPNGEKFEFYHAKSVQKYGATLFGIMKKRGIDIDNM